ncbi:hypothetical protein IVB33_33055 [Bradyrhizobium sp. 24]|uniref:hypothetical protein n=1 Tax=unclassified Bradyrhizobium TaxID=2631580 RepID=UPI001FFBC4E3|nr:MULTISPECIES: hypothetical protein [unclassified Bradyrhizobium]MCK1299684.1 hypothetical protein [Bradyrhizobium sp. 37]MCK1381560.1 hypothetical protein [Bradyrhizobium sp. 24]MCK1768646.1 hypothetical protein [Bradyrhizobium sp. 134]
MPYNERADAQLKQLGNQLVDQLIGRALRHNPTDTMGAFAQATRLAEALVGFLPIGDGPNSRADHEIAAAIPRVKAILAMMTMYEG